MVRTMRDVVAHPQREAHAAFLAAELAARLDLDVEPLPAAGGGDAVLEVAPWRRHRHRDPAAPVVVLPGMRRRHRALTGRTVLCGVHDDADVTTAAAASALAGAIGMDLVIATVIPQPAIWVPGPIAPPLSSWVSRDDRARAQRTLLRVVSDAGIAGSSVGAYHIRSGAPGPTLAALAQAEDAALVAVSASIRPWPVRLLIGSAVNHLARHCARPVVVCPRDPRAAMRLREALGWPVPPRTAGEHSGRRRPPRGS